MDQLRIGKFISEKRKTKGMTQAQLAEKLGITDRAVSKWETGRSMPDVSIMLELCDMLGITVNDLLCGEVVSMERFNETTERNLIEMARQKEESDKRLLNIEIVLMTIAGLFLLVMLLTAIFITKESLLSFGLISLGFVTFIIASLFALRIEQTAGYYECGKCGNRYIPTYMNVNKAMNMGRKRYMKCPQCGKKSWQKKVTGKE